MDKQGTTEHFIKETLQLDIKMYNSFLYSL